MQRLLPTSSRDLAALLARGQELARLGQAVQSQLPAGLAEHCQVANVREDTLVLVVDSPAWATRLRYGLPPLIQYLQKNGWPQIRKSQLRVCPPTTPTREPRQAVMSLQVGKLLKAVAEGCGDPALAAAWRRLARHAKD